VKAEELRAAQAPLKERYCVVYRTLAGVRVEVHHTTCLH
jgi:hypothetical protein